MIFSSEYVTSIALHPETTSNTTITKLNTSDFEVAMLLLWKLQWHQLARLLYS